MSSQRFSLDLQRAVYISKPVRGRLLMLLRGPHNGCMSTTAELNVRKQEFDNEVFDYDPLQLSLDHNSSHPAIQKKPKRDSVLRESACLFRTEAASASIPGIPHRPPFCCLFCPLESIWQNIFAHATRRQTLRQVRPSARDKRDARYKNNISIRVKFGFCFVFFFLRRCISRGLRSIESEENKQRWDVKYKMCGQTRRRI